jgi:hypothetical protein
MGKGSHEASLAIAIDAAPVTIRLSVTETGFANARRRAGERRCRLK